VDELAWFALPIDIDEIAGLGLLELELVAVDGSVE
jgi:hypothetical protein